jgi:hypothetical protein
MFLISVQASATQHGRGPYYDWDLDRLKFDCLEECARECGISLHGDWTTTMTRRVARRMKTTYLRD